MNQALNTANDSTQERVIKHLQTADGLLIIVPMIIAVTLGFTSAFTAPDSPMIGLGLASIILGFFFCAAYGFLALILSLLTRRNRTFRVLLVVIPVITTVILFVLFINSGRG